MRGTRVAIPLLLAATGASFDASAQAPPPPVFRASVENVYVDAFVTRHGRPMPGLHASDFELKDNGVVQSPELLGTDAPPLSAVLAFDTSSSVAGRKLAALSAAARAFLDGLRARDRVGLLAFRQEIEWLVPPTSDRGAVCAALGRLRAGGATSMLDALYAAIVLPGTQTRSLVVLFSDGRDNLSWLDEAEVQEIAERSNALVHVVAIRPEAASSATASTSPWGSWFASTRLSQSEPPYIRGLREIAETTGGRLWWAESLSQLTSAFAAIAAAMNERYVLRYEPKSVERMGWHRIELELRGRAGDVQARRGYWVAAR
jgi:VWFA-related protein